MAVPNGVSSLGNKWLREGGAALTVAAVLGVFDNFMFGRRAFASLEQLFAPFDLVVADMTASPSLIHLRAHLGVVCVENASIEDWALLHV